MMRRGDKILVILVACAIVFGIGFKLYNNNKYKGKSGVAIVEIDGKIFGRYDLNKTENEEIDLKPKRGEKSILEIKDKRVRIKEADCPDKVCVRTGWISKPGEIIVCLPYKIIVKISGEGQDVDINTF